jgi:carbamoyl-phosphate synthase small subunit
MPVNSIAPPRTRPTTAHLVLADGEVFEGEAIGFQPTSGVATGEVVFNTALSGYQEVLTDPSYAGQIITFTATHIGNYGTNAIDDESSRPFCRGVIVRELARRHSNHHATESLPDFLVRTKVSGIAGIDTRRLTRHLRDGGAQPGAFGTADHATLLAAAKAEPGTNGVDFLTEVSTPEPYTVGDGPWRVVAYDFGIKRTILRHLGRIATVTVVPASMRADEVLALGPDGVFLANGPGDPAVCSAQVAEIRALMNERTPIFGICLGQQLLAAAAGASTFKLPFGHHGGNHPVKDLRTGRVMITSQNHNFCVDHTTLDVAADITHLNLNDGTLEGLAYRDLPMFSVQHHPEAGPGPHESASLFDEFADLLVRVHGQPSGPITKAVA